MSRTYYIYKECPRLSNARFFDAVKQRPALWNQHHEDYDKGSVTWPLWWEVAAIVGKGTAEDVKRDFLRKRRGYEKFLCGKIDHWSNARVMSFLGNEIITLSEREQGKKKRQSGGAENREAVAPASPADGRDTTADYMSADDLDVEDSMPSTSYAASRAPRNKESLVTMSDIEEEDSPPGDISTAATAAASTAAEPIMQMPIEAGAPDMPTSPPAVTAQDHKTSSAGGMLTPKQMWMRRHIEDQRAAAQAATAAAAAMNGSVQQSAASTAHSAPTKKVIFVKKNPPNKFVPSTLHTQKTTVFTPLGASGARGGLAISMPTSPFAPSLLALQNPFMPGASSAFPTNPEAINMLRAALAREVAPAAKKPAAPPMTLEQMKQWQEKQQEEQKVAAAAAVSSAIMKRSVVGAAHSSDLAVCTIENPSIAGPSTSSSLHHLGRGPTGGSSSWQPKTPEDNPSIAGPSTSASLHHLESGPTGGPSWRLKTQQDINIEAAINQTEVALAVANAMLQESGKPTTTQAAPTKKRPNTSSIPKPIVPTVPRSSLKVIVPSGEAGSTVRTSKDGDFPSRVTAYWKWFDCLIHAIEESRKELGDHSQLDYSALHAELQRDPRAFWLGKDTTKILLRQLYNWLLARNREEMCAFFEKLAYKIRAVAPDDAKSFLDRAAQLRASAPVMETARTMTLSVAERKSREWLAKLRVANEKMMEVAKEVIVVIRHRLFTWKDYEQHLANVPEGVKKRTLDAHAAMKKLASLSDQSAPSTVSPSAARAAPINAKPSTVGANQSKDKMTSNEILALEMQEEQKKFAAREAKAKAACSITQKPVVSTNKSAVAPTTQKSTAVAAAAAPDDATAPITQMATLAASNACTVKSMTQTVQKIASQNGAQQPDQSALEKGLAKLKADYEKQCASLRAQADAAASDTPLPTSVAAQPAIPAAAAAATTTQKTPVCINLDDDDVILIEEEGEERARRSGSVDSDIVVLEHIIDLEKESAARTPRTTAFIPELEEMRRSLAARTSPTAASPVLLAENPTVSAAAIDTAEPSTSERAANKDSETSVATGVEATLPIQEPADPNVPFLKVTDTAALASINDKLVKMGFASETSTIQSKTVEPAKSAAASKRKLPSREKDSEKQKEDTKVRRIWQIAAASSDSKEKSDFSLPADIAAGTTDTVLYEGTHQHKLAVVGGDALGAENEKSGGDASGAHKKKGGAGGVKPLALANKADAAVNEVESVGRKRRSSASEAAAAAVDPLPKRARGRPPTRPETIARRTSEIAARVAAAAAAGDAPSTSNDTVAGPSTSMDAVTASTSKDTLLSSSASNYTVNSSDSKDSDVSLKNKPIRRLTVPRSRYTPGPRK